MRPAPTVVPPVKLSVCRTQAGPWRPVGANRIPVATMGGTVALGLFLALTVSGVLWQ